MPAPHSFWVIVDGATPTAFRARQRDDLLPTLKQLQRTQPAVVLRWFDRGRLWESPIEAKEALKAKRGLRSGRGPGWRPGGTHSDPRERFKLTRDQKRARFKRRRFGKPGTSEAGKPGSWGAGKPGGWGAGKTGKPGGGRPFRAGGRPPRSQTRRPRGPKRDR